jgi:DNA-binding winged helix-turn-helix (wHTH) protein/tetratricopeptide (TPR) repeat protein
MSAPAVFRFDTFELHTGPGELRQHGDVVKLAPQPLKVLELLVRRSGKILTRNEIREHVWCGDTFVDFEQGLNFCIRQIREALGDTAHAPRFVETIPRRGYRFLMPVKAADEVEPVQLTRLIVLPFRMLRPDADTEFLAFSLPDAITGSLAGLDSLVVRSSVAAGRFVVDKEAPDPKKIAVEADVDVIVTGAVMRAGDAVRVSAQLTDASTGTLLWSDTAQAPVGDLFRLQDDLTQHIVASLSLPLTSRDQQRLQRDVPASARAYDFFLRGNQLSYDSKQWSVARDLYLRAVEEDSRYAPAWARLGRIHHVMAKYLETGTRDGFDRAEAAFRRALELNPELTMAHKLFAQLEVDLGRARDAMTRLIERAQSADAELLAGLVSACRYCGLLDASVAAHDRAATLEPRVRTSVPHTWFLQGDYARVAASRIAEYPYIVALSLSALGRSDQALPALRDLEQATRTRLRDFAVAARTLIEGRADESLAAVRRILASDFRDPEGLFYLSRHLARLNEGEPAVDLLQRVVAGGFFCYPAMASDPWLDPLRKKPAFTKLLREAETRHREASTLFTQSGGDRTLGAYAVS